MGITLNEKQIEGLASFLFDLAKGLILGTIGAAAVGGIQILIAVTGSLSAALCVYGALHLLGRL